MFKGGEEEGKVLGIVWNQKVDKLCFEVKAGWFNVSEFTEIGQVTLTKQQILSKVARLYDPIRLASAFLIGAKIGIQHLWQLGVGWDKELPPTVQDQWMRLFQEMMELNHVCFLRALLTIGATEQPSLCTFSASQ